MKVILVNGSPHESGCTYTALSEIANTFAKEDIQPDIFWIGNKPLYSCVDCGKCGEKGCCVFEDRVNEFLAIAGDYDGFIFVSPVHYAGGFLPLLEYGTWKHTGAGQGGSGRLAESQDAGKEYGMVPEVQGSRGEDGRVIA